MLTPLTRDWDGTRVLFLGEVIPAEQPIQFAILKNPPLFNVLSQAPFIAYAKLLHDPPRGWIAFEIGGVQPVESKDIEPIPDHRLRCLSAITTIPEGFSDPIAEFRAGMLLGEL